MKAILLLFFLSLFCRVSPAQEISTFFTGDSVRITIDRGGNYSPKKKTTIIFYALPNGNTTEQTMGKIMMEGDDWHYDIQHIAAQTRFIRSRMPSRNIVVVYLGNNLLSWPAWKGRHPAFRQRIPALIDSITRMIPGRRKEVFLNGHSGGGSFIFGYLAGVGRIPKKVKRISFLDSNYGYDSSYFSKLKRWLMSVKGASLNVFAYNDSIVIYNGKPLVSPTGGTWYRSRLMIRHLEKDFNLRKVHKDSMIVYRSPDGRIQFYLRENPGAEILHTRQVEYNGFIHSILCGTSFESIEYEYFGRRAYNLFIQPTKD